MVGLTLNANALPGDKAAAFRPSGVRLGTPAITTRGMGAFEMKQIAEWMEKVAKICQDVPAEDKLIEKFAEFAEIREEVKKTALEFPVPGV